MTASSHGDGDLWVVDAGNTAWKWVRFDGDGAVLDFLSLAAGERPPADRLPDDADVVSCAVSPEGPEAVDVALHRSVPCLGRDFPCAVPQRVARPGETGLDRLAAACAAHRRVGGAAVAVMAGTAVTVDAVARDGTFLGGAIAPGMTAASRGLHRAAPRLPVVRPWEPSGPTAFPGRGTETSLEAGLLLGWAGLVDRLVAEARALLDAEAPGGAAAPVLLSGGDGDALRPHLRTAVLPVTALVAEGVRHLHRSPIL